MPSPNISPTTRLFVGGLPYRITEGELLSLFATYGRLVSLKIMHTKWGKSRGMGFVEFDNLDSAINAKQHLHNYQIDEDRTKKSHQSKKISLLATLLSSKIGDQINLHRINFLRSPFLQREKRRSREGFWGGSQNLAKQTVNLSMIPVPTTLVSVPSLPNEEPDKRALFSPFRTYFVFQSWHNWHGCYRFFMHLLLFQKYLHRNSSCHLWIQLYASPNQQSSVYHRTLIGSRCYLCIKLHPLPHWDATGQTTLSLCHKLFKVPLANQ